MGNYKVKVGSEAESKEVQGFLIESGYKRPYANFVLHNGWVCINDKKQIMCVCESQAGSEIDIYEEIKFNELRDIVVLKRNDVADATHKCIYDNIPEYFMASDGVLYFYKNTDWVRTKNTKLWCDTHLKPITKEPVMKEYLVKSQDGKWRLETEVVGDPGDDIIEVPDGADTLAGDERTHYFWKHGVGVKGNMLIGCGESLSRYPKWDDCEDSADEWLGQINCKHSRILWQRETLNDKVASAEVARQEFIGVPFSDLPESNFEAVDEFVESNVEQTLSDRESTYGSFSDVADTTQKLMSFLALKDCSCVQQEAMHMICSKLARIANGDPYHVDSWHDIAGYATLVVKDINGDS